MKGNMRKQKVDRDEGRDVSERIALGMLKGSGAGAATGEALYDSRLFNQVSFHMHIHSYRLIHTCIHTYTVIMLPYRCTINAAITTQTNLFTNILTPLSLFHFPLFSVGGYGFWLWCRG